MKSLIAILTGLHVLAHGIFGCCDHGLAVPSPAARPCVCHHAHHDSHSVPSSHFHDSDNVTYDEPPSRVPPQCVHSSCDWLAGSARYSISPPISPTSIPCVVTALPSGLASHAAEFRPDAAIDPSPAPPLRLHLALGVLLI